MAKPFVRMATDNNCPEKCRAARRRRIEMRRLSAFAGATSPQPSCSSRTEKRRDRSDRTDEEKRSRTERSRSPSQSPPVIATEEQPAVPSTSGQAPPPVFGYMSISGRSREMEDAISLQPYFFRPEVPGRLPLHFFAVFDGHGGSHVNLSVATSTPKKCILYNTPNNGIYKLSSGYRNKLTFTYISVDTTRHDTTLL